MNKYINVNINIQYFILSLFVIATIYNAYYFRSKMTTIVMIFIITGFALMLELPDKINNTDMKNLQNLKEEHFNETIVDRVNPIPECRNHEYHVSTSGLYNVYKKPSKFVFLPQNDFFRDILYDLRFIRRYDEGDYIKLTILIENFLKTYYNIITDNYDRSYLSQVEEVRREILNVMYNFIVDAPMFDNNKKRLDILIKDAIYKVQAFTYKKLKNLSKKYPDYNPKHPRGISSEVNDSYHVIV